MGKGYSPSMRRLALLLFLAFFWLPLQAAQLAVVLGGEEGAYREFLGTLKGAVGGSDWQVSWEGSSEKFQQAPPAGVDLIVAVGSQAARVALARADGPPVIATLLTRSAYETVRAESPARRSGITALYLDQPLQRQIAFIQRLLPDNRRVMTVVSDKLADQLPQLKRLGNAAKLSVDTAVLNTGDSLVPVLERVLGQEGVYLALPDSVLYSRDNIRPFPAHHLPLPAAGGGFFRRLRPGRGPGRPAYHAGPAGPGSGSVDQPPAPGSPGAAAGPGAFPFFRGHQYPGGPLLQTHPAR